MADPFGKKVERIKSVVKAFLQQIPFEMQLYAIENMGEDIGSEAFRNTPKGQGLNLRGVPINKTNRLRFQTNRLGTALAPGGKGNISKVDVEDGVISLRYGIDPAVVPYAAIHEFGGDAGRNGSVKLRARPYLRPAYKMFLEKSIPRFLNRLKKELEKD